MDDRRLNQFVFLWPVESNVTKTLLSRETKLSTYTHILDARAQDTVSQLLYQYFHDPTQKSWSKPWTPSPSP